jgi:SAM-dependent methyltransferase
MDSDRDYVLGTHDDEVERLGIQHRVWRPRALRAWQRAGFRTGQTLLDVGCGPGWATRDLAELVGPSGRVVAIDRSRRFLDVVETSRRERRLTQIEPLELDLNDPAIPHVGADGAWCRWVFAFVKDPRALLRGVAAALRPGGILVAHEYFDYGAWGISPRSADMEAFVQTVMRSWRDEGGEPDIALDLVRWLRDAGLELRTLTPMLDVITPASHVWEWPKTFAAVGTRRLVDLGYLDADRSAAVTNALAAWERSGDGLMTTPGVLEIIATRCPAS